MSSVGRRMVPALVACVALLAGCKTVPLRTHALSPDPKPFPGQAIFTVDWRVELVGWRIWESSPREYAQPIVDPDTGRVIVATRDGKVWSVNPEGKVEWTFQTQGPFAAGPSLDGGVVFVPGGDGFLYALRASDGALLWKYEAGEELATSPRRAGPNVLVASQANTLFAVDAQSGKWVWQYRRDLPAGMLLRGVSAPLLHEGTAYLGFSDGAVAALDAVSGQIRWERLLSTSGAAFLDVDTTPVLDEAGRVVVASYPEGVIALDPATGDLAWTRPIPQITSLLRQGPVVFTGGAHALGAVHLESGQALWELRLGNPDRSTRGLTMAKGTLLAPVDSALLFVDPASGRPQLYWDPGQGVSAIPATRGSRIYVLSNLGYLYALRLEGA